MQQPYCSCMFDVAASLQQGLKAGDDRLQTAQNSLAEANAMGRSSADGAMAKTAQAAIFTQALLGAVHSRLSEIKAVAK